MTESRSLRGRALLVAGVVACAAAGAQQATQPSAAASAAERAQRETDRTMYWIRIVSSKPAPPKPAPAPRSPAVAARPTAETREKAHVAAAPTPADGKPSLAAQPTLPKQEAVSPAAEAAMSTASPVIAPADSAAPLVVEPTPSPAPELAPAEEPDPGLVQTASAQPDFPADLVRRLHKGNVEIRFEVDPDGKVVDATVVDSSHSHLNRAAVLAVKQWRFKPAPVSHVALVNLVFDTDNEKPSTR